MADPADQDRMRALEDRITALKGEPEVTHTSESHFEQVHLGWRMVIEMVAGLLIGFGMGYGLDVLFGTLPIFLVLFTLLGFVAGVRVMMRTAQEAQNHEQAIAADDDDKRD